MATEETKRRLAAILSADAKDYSRLMSQDEVGTIRTLNAHRETIGRCVQQYEGRVVDTPGDNVLAEFVSVTNAVNCAVEIQSELAERNREVPAERTMAFRIGINLGDVVAVGERIYGDSVNIAARAEALAPAGGVCITGTVHDQVKNRLGFEYDDCGEQTVKNIPEPIRTYTVRSLPASGTRAWNGEGEPPLSVRPAIAVLPFSNMSSDPDNEYFSDGISEEIRNALAKTNSMPVIARTASFQFKGEKVGTQAGIPATAA